MMFTIIIPTLNHQDTIIYAVQSILEQTLQDFEIFIVSDGAPPRTKQIAEQLIKKDARIRYFDNPKGEGYGEAHRAEAIKHAQGTFIGYCGDDDLWLPHHLETLRPWLDDYDFVHTTQPTVINEGAGINFHTGDLKNKLLRKKMMNEKFNFFGPTTVSHRLDSYRKLPYGWRPKPDNMYSDLHMWRQWLSEDWVLFKSLPDPTVLHLQDAQHNTLTTEQRCQKMIRWLDRFKHEEFPSWLISEQQKNHPERQPKTRRNVKIVRIIKQMLSLK